MNNITLHRLRHGRFAFTVVHIVLFCFGVVACGGDGSSTAGPVDTGPGRIELISPEADLRYVGGAPPIIAVATPPLTAAELAELVVTVDGVDVSDRMIDLGGLLFSSSYSDAVGTTASRLVMTLGDEIRRVDFEFDACPEGCSGPVKPVIKGPASAPALDQASLWGTGFGRSGDRRVLKVNGAEAEWVGGHFGDDWVMFVVPPLLSGAESLELVFEVNGVPSDPWTMTVTAPPTLDEPAETIVANFSQGLTDVVTAAAAVAPWPTGNDALDARIATLRPTLVAALDANLGHLQGELSALDADEAKLLADFLNQGRLDEILGNLAASAVKEEQPKADLGPVALETACARDILSIYKLVTTLALVQDALNALSYALLLLSVFYPPAAALVLTVTKLMAFTGKLISMLRLFIMTVLPDVVGATLTLPAQVPRLGEVPVTGTVTLVYDPQKKVLAIGEWAIGEVLGKTLETYIDPTGEAFEIPAPIVELAKKAFDETLGFGNYVKGLVRDGATVAQPQTVPAAPPLLGFDARFFEISQSDRGVCEGTGKWSEDAPCEVEDRWEIGWNLAYTGYYDLLFSKTLDSGTVKTDAEAILIEYDDPDYGSWMEFVGAKAGCEVLQQCWDEAFSEGNCVPGLGNLTCNEVSYGGRCPTLADVELATRVCEACGQNE